jgi:hypothetical protein
MTVVFETTPCCTTLEKPAMPLVLRYGKTVRINTPEIRSMDETHVHKDPSGPLDREKTQIFIIETGIRPGWFFDSF